MRQAEAACALTRWQHFSAWNDVMAAILKVWSHIGNLTPYLFHPDPIWNEGASSFFESRRPNNKKNNNNEIGDDMKLVLCQ